MIQPPIDKLIDKVGCKFALVCLVTKRAHYIVEKKSDALFESKETPLTYAAREIFEGKIEHKDDQIWVNNH
ncbi:MAG: DNA-directed RNA polymerase subunit omega [Clostridiales bacterium]|jgi:DNA-directed RNA polymerase omega subunit|nr:DNA-directed RNA polymerase subunit omega [Clostridiales bacterium]